MINPTEKMLQAGAMALLQCTESELSDYSVKLMDGYLEDCKRVFIAMSQAGALAESRAVVALSELVRLKDLKSELALGSALGCMTKTKHEEMKNDYASSKERAWAAARHVLSTPSSAVQAAPVVQEAPGAMPEGMKTRDGNPMTKTNWLHQRKMQALMENSEAVEKAAIEEFPKGSIVHWKHGIGYRQGEVVAHVHTSLYVKLTSGNRAEVSVDANRVNLGPRRKQSQAEGSGS